MMGLVYWARVCVAAGLDPRKMTPMDVYIVGGRISGDAIVVERKRLQHVSAVEAVRAMTEEERTALCIRVKS